MIVTVDELWNALVKICASTKQDYHHEVKNLVMINKQDIKKALELLDAK